MIILSFFFNYTLYALTFTCADIITNVISISRCGLSISLQLRAHNNYSPPVLPGIKRLNLNNIIVILGLKITVVIIMGLNLKSLNYLSLVHENGEHRRRLNTNSLITEEVTDWCG